MYEEILKLKGILDNARLPYKMHEVFGGYVIIVQDPTRYAKNLATVKQHDQSAKSKDGLMEFYSESLVTDYNATGMKIVNVDEAYSLIVDCIL